MKEMQPETLDEEDLSDWFRDQLYGRVKAAIADAADVISHVEEISYEITKAMHKPVLDAVAAAAAETVHGLLIRQQSVTLCAITNNPDGETDVLDFELTLSNWLDFLVYRNHSILLSELLTDDNADGLGRQLAGVLRCIADKLDPV